MVPRPLGFACFVIATHKRGFNNAAWLLYEAGRYGDLDLSMLEQGSALYKSASYGAHEWWMRASMHARGPTASRFYALCAADTAARLRPHSFKLLLSTGTRPAVWEHGEHFQVLAKELLLRKYPMAVADSALLNGTHKLPSPQFTH